MSLLTLKDIGKIYASKGNVAVGIRGVNLSFERGEFVAITGKSGSGKSTLLSVISGMDSYEEGDLLIEGESTSHYLQADFEEYREIIDIVSRKEDVHIICGVDLMKSVFSGYPGTFVGIGNCLVSTREEGKADVTYVGDDTLMSLPTPMNFPDAPSFTETIIFLNSLQKGE